MCAHTAVRNAEHASADKITSSHGKFLRSNSVFYEICAAEVELLRTSGRSVRGDARFPCFILMKTSHDTLSGYFFLLLRTSDDDSTTEKKVTMLLETVSKVKWKTAESVEEEEEEKVCVEMRCLLVLVTPCL